MSYERLDLDHYFSEIAKITRKRSTCPKAQVGAVLVKDGSLMSSGYNGAPRGYPHCADREGGCVIANNHCLTAVHAEVNCILQATSAKDATLYCTHLCCLDCCKVCINSGVRRIVFSIPYYDDRCKYFEIESQVEFLERAQIEVVHIKLADDLCVA